MAVSNFFFGGIPDSVNLHLEGQHLTSQWVVGINIHIKSSDLDDSDLDRPLLAL